MRWSQDAEALAPNSADVLALKGRILRHLGRPSEAYVALDAAHTLSPRDEDVSHRPRAHPAHRRAPRPRRRRPGGVARRHPRGVDRRRRRRRPSRRLAARFGRVQWQDGPASTNAAGGGVEWRLGRHVSAAARSSSRRARRGSPGPTSPASSSRRRPDAAGHRLRYLDFAGARVWIVAPSISVDLNDNVALAARYYRSESEFLPSGRRAGNNSGAIMGRWQAARRLSLSAA